MSLFTKLFTRHPEPNGEGRVRSTKRRDKKENELVEQIQETIEHDKTDMAEQ